MKRVLTFGVYDILHIGHVLLFKRAKDLGDYLIVAVQEDEYVLKYKPNTSLIYTTSERVFMVNAIKYVDEVVIYKNIDDDIKNIDFDLFVRGEDQQHQGFQKAIEWCNEHGKDNAILTRTEGISSSTLRTKL